MSQSQSIMQYDEDEEEEEENEEIDADDSRQGSEVLQLNNNMIITTHQEKSRASISIAPLSPIKGKKRHRRYISISKGMEMEMEDNVGFQILVRANIINYHSVTQRFDRRPSFEILSVLG